MKWKMVELTTDELGGSQSVQSTLLAQNVQVKQNVQNNVAKHIAWCCTCNISLNLLNNPMWCRYYYYHSHFKKEGTRHTEVA